MNIFDWERLFLGENPATFLYEVAFRAFIMFVLITISLRLSGRRGIKQISIFEMVIIIGLGTAAGDPMLHKDVGLVPAAIVLGVVVLLYRILTMFVAKSEKAENLIEGKPLYIIKEGKFAIEDFDKDTVAQDEFFSELRLYSVEHLGQVKYAIMETSGDVSVFFYSEENTRPGLPILPEQYNRKSTIIMHNGIYSCVFCGHTDSLISGSQKCDICKHDVWVEAINSLRIT